MNKERELLRQIHYCWACVDALEDENDQEVKDLNEVMREAEHYLFHEKEVDYPFEGWRLREIYFEDGTALMHREPSEPESDKPVAWTSQNELNALGTDGTCYMYSEPMIGENNIPLYTRPEPEDEPVAWIHVLYGETENALIDNRHPDTFDRYWEHTPLYTHPDMKSKEKTR